MTTLRSLGVLAALAYALAGCAQTTAPKANTVTAREQDAVAPLKDKYKDVITGLDVKNRTLVVYVEPNAMYSMDEGAEAAMKAEALRRWKTAWVKEHPRQHGVLRVDVRDYFGREISTDSTTI